MTSEMAEHVFKGRNCKHCQLNTFCGLTDLSIKIFKELCYLQIIKEGK